MNFEWIKTAKQQANPTVGSVLDVGLPDLGVSSIAAKVDTGAFSGSLHADDIRETKNEAGKRQLQFVPFGGNGSVVTIAKYHRRNIKSSNGQSTIRFAFETTITILDQSYPIIISLSDRSSMKYQMLIGRKFLKTNGFLVDVSLNNQ